MSDVIGSEGVLGAFLETIKALAVDGAQLEEVAHGDLLRVVIAASVLAVQS